MSTKKPTQSKYKLEQYAATQSLDRRAKEISEYARIPLMDAYKIASKESCREVPVEPK